MSTKEARAVFESRLQVYLKESLADFKPLKVNKNKLVLSNGKTKGELDFQYLNKSNGYVLHMWADVPEFSDYINHLQPPYKSNLLSDYLYAMTSSGETSKLFSNQYGGVLRLPRNETDIENTCLWIESRLRTIFLPRMLNMLEMKESLIEDVLNDPIRFAYPFLTIMMVISKNQLQPTPQQIELFLSKRICGNKKFDRDLINNHLNAFLP